MCGNLYPYLNKENKYYSDILLIPISRYVGVKSK